MARAVERVRRGFRGRAAAALASVAFSLLLSGCGFGWLYMRVGDSHRIQGMKILSYDKTQKRFQNARAEYKKALQYYEDSILYDELGNPEVYYRGGETNLLLDPPQLEAAENMFQGGLRAKRKIFDISGLTSADRIETTSSGVQWVNLKDAVYSQLHAGVGMVSYLRGIADKDEAKFAKAMEYLDIADTTAPRFTKSEGAQGFIDDVMNWLDLTEIVTPCPVPILVAQVWNYRGKLALARGEDLLAAQYFQLAEEALNRIKEFYPKDARLLAEYTNLYYLRKQYDKCGQYLDEMLKTHNYADKVSYSILKGNILNELGKHEEAIAIFSELIEVDPGNIRALVGRSMGYAAKGDTTQAQSDLEAFLAQGSDDPLLFLFAGRIYNQMKQFSSAEQMLLKAFYARPDDIEVNFELGKLFRQIGKKAEMDTAFRKVIRLGPQSTYGQEARKYVGQ